MKFKSRVVKNIIKSNKLSPNKCEQLLMAILNLLTSDYKFVGDGKIMIDGFNPDFINIKERKIIEFYGNYWHERTDYIKRDRKRLKSYEANSYKTLIIWEDELKDLDLLCGKILSFSGDK